MALGLSNEAADVGVEAGGGELDNATMILYAGTRPLTTNTAIGAQTVLVEATFGTPAFGDPDDGVLTANAITGGTVAASGQAAFFRIFKADDTPLIDGDVGTGAPADLVLNSVNFVAGRNFTISGLTLTLPKSA